MDPASIAAALIASRIGQAQIAVAARMMRDQASMEAAAVQQLLAAANRSADQLAACRKARRWRDGGHHRMSAGSLNTAA